MEELKVQIGYYSWFIFMIFASFDDLWFFMFNYMIYYLCIIATIAIAGNLWYIMEEYSIFKNFARKLMWLYIYFVFTYASYTNVTLPKFQTMNPLYEMHNGK